MCIYVYICVYIYLPICIYKLGLTRVYPFAPFVLLHPPLYLVGPFSMLIYTYTHISGVADTPLA